MCDLLCATPAVTGGPMLFAKNSDRPTDEDQVWEWHPPRDEPAGTEATYVRVPWGGSARTRTLGVFGSRPAWGWGLEHGVNEAGLAAGNATIFTTADPRGRPDGLTGMDVVRLVLERTATAREAVALVVHLLRTVGQGGSGHEDADRPYWSSFLFADPVEAVVVETSDRTWAIEPVGGARATSNRTTIPSFDVVHRHPRQPVERLVDPRWEASRRCLAGDTVDVEALRAHLSSHVGGDDGWTICMHVDEPGHEEATTSSMVAELRADRSPVVHHAVGSPCRARWQRTDLGAFA